MSKDVLAIIPARSGSKGVPYKNIRLLAGHPLLAWSIIAVQLAKNISRIIVSTDSKEYAEVALRYGAEVPFLRPAVIATDEAQDIGFIIHALLWLVEHEGSIPELLVHLRPTNPIRDPALIDSAIELMWADPLATSLCSAHEVAHPPCKYYKLDADSTFSGLMGEDYLSLPRQQCPKAYHGNGYVDILNPRHILQNGSLYGSRRLAFLTPPNWDIDSTQEFEALAHSDIIKNSILKQGFDHIIT